MAVISRTFDTALTTPYVHAVVDRFVAFACACGCWDTILIKRPGAGVEMPCGNEYRIDKEGMLRFFCKHHRIITR
jgi:hypothetical protein